VVWHVVIHVAETFIVSFNSGNWSCMFLWSGIKYLPIYGVIQRNAAGKLMETHDSLHKRIGLQVNQYDVYSPRERINCREIVPAVMKTAYKCHAKFFKNGNHTADLGVHASIILKMVIKK